MKIKNILQIGFLSLLFLALTSGLYEEGPFISFRTKKARLVREWVLEKYISSDNSEDLDVENLTYQIKSDGNAVATFVYDNKESKQNFKWEFTEDKKFIKFINETDFYKEKILRLTAKELWLEDEDGDKTYLKAKPKK